MLHLDSSSPMWSNGAIPDNQFIIKQQGVKKSAFSPKVVAGSTPKSWQSHSQDVLKQLHLPRVTCRKGTKFSEGTTWPFSIFRRFPAR